MCAVANLTNPANSTDGTPGKPNEAGLTNVAPASRVESNTTSEPAGAEVTITLLGSFAVSVAGVPAEAGLWRRRQAAALVKVLALAPGRMLHREQVMDLLWPDLVLEEAATRLHKAAHYARRTLGDVKGLVLAGEVVSLFPGRNARVDAVDFATLAGKAVATGDRSAAAAAVELYTGELLPLDRYDSWVLDARDRMQLLYLEILRLSQQWQVLASVDPTDEQAHLALIARMRERGDRTAALRQFDRLTRALREELGIGPSAEALRVRTLLDRAPQAPAPASRPSLAPRAPMSSRELAGAR